MLTNSLNNQIPAPVCTLSRGSASAVQAVVQAADIAGAEAVSAINTADAASAAYSQVTIPAAKSYVAGVASAGSTDFKVIDVTSLPGTEVTAINSADATISLPTLTVSMTTGTYAAVSNSTANNCVIDVRTDGTGRPNLCCYRGAGRNGFWYYNDALGVAGWGGYGTGTPPQAPPVSGGVGFFNTSGSFLRTAHPWVFARQSADVANVTGDGTDYAMVATEVAEQGNYWVSPTYTAGATGIYYVACQIRWALNGSTATTGTVRIVSTGRTLVACNFDTATLRTQSTVPVNVTIPLTVGDTFQVRLQLSGGTKVVTYLGNPLRTTICAYKVA